MSAFGWSQRPHPTDIPIATVVDHWPPHVRLVEIDGNQYLATQSSAGYWVICPRTIPALDPKKTILAPAQDQEPK